MMTTSARASARLGQVTKHFSTSSPARKEIQDAYIVGAARTPVGVFNGAFTSVPAPKLGATAIRAAIDRSGIDSKHITSVYMGNVLSAGSGQAPARQATIYAGLPPTVEATTINKVCASGLKSIALAAQDIQLGLAPAVVAGGMENMSRVPYLLPRASQQPAFGEQKLVDAMIADGLWDPYNNIHMGSCAENTVKNFSLTREAQDAFAIESYKRAQEGWKSGAFADEVVPVEVPGKKKGTTTTVTEDEGPSRINIDKVPTLKPAFDRSANGTVTAANASSFNDGASAVVVANGELAAQVAGKSRVLAKILGAADAATDPIDFTIAPAKAVPIALERAGVKKEDVAVWEFNEAFAAVVLANAKILGLDSEADMKKVNPLGGAIALGHAIGSSGARIMVTMLHRLKVGEIGVAAICNGGGAASAMVVQRVDSV